jgi:hypothetical protein
MALGTALIGGILLASLTTGFQDSVAKDSTLPASVKTLVAEETDAGVQVVPESAAVATARSAGLSESQVQQVSDHYMAAQINGLRLSLAIVAILALLSLLLTTGLPARPVGEATLE